MFKQNGSNASILSRITRWLVSLNETTKFGLVTINNDLQLSLCPTGVIFSLFSAAVHLFLAVKLLLDFGFFFKFDTICYLVIRVLFGYP